MEANTSQSLLALATGCGILAACGDAESPSGTAEVRSQPHLPPDVVLIVVDTLRADAVFDPAGEYDTPHIDRLASDGIAFERTFSAAPMTLPSHMSLFSSRPVLETGVSNNGQKVPADLPLLAEWLAQLGYDTRAVLSLGTLDPRDRTRSPGRGFASYDHDYRHFAPAQDTLERLRASLAGRAAEKPLFLFAHFSDPHEPYESHGTQTQPVQVSMNDAPLVRLQVADMQQWSQTVVLGSGLSVFEFEPEQGQKLRKPQIMVRYFDCLEDGRRLPVEWQSGKEMQRVTSARVVVDRGGSRSAECELRMWVNDVPLSDSVRRKRYALEVAHVDRYVGELLAELERLGLYRDSLVLFTSDHGEGLGEHGAFGHIENLSDSLIRVPLLIKLPRDAARRSELAAAAGRLVSHVDVVPTLLEIAGLPPLPGQRGTSLFTPHAAVHLAQASRPEARKNQLAFRDEHFKMIYFADEERFELYDLVADPRELRDVFAEREGERAAWPEQLRVLYRSAREPSADDEADREERDRMLRALGYGGGEE